MVKTTIYCVVIGVGILSSAGCRGLLRTSVGAVKVAEERAKTIERQQSISSLLLNNKQDSLLVAARKLVAKQSTGLESNSDKSQNLTDQQIIDQATKILIFKLADAIDNQPYSKEVLPSVRLHVLDIKKTKQDSSGRNLYIATVIISNGHPVAIKSFEAQLAGWSPNEPLKTKWFGYVAGGNGKDTFVMPNSSKKAILPVLDPITFVVSNPISSKQDLGWSPRFSPPTTKNLQVESHTTRVTDGTFDYSIAFRPSLSDEVYNYLSAIRRIK